VLKDRVAGLDVDLFRTIESETTSEDKRSLLAIHAAVAARAEAFSYLEIGSHLGGSLQVVVADPRCDHITSIDPRPRFQPDDRPQAPVFEYVGNSTERMMGLLGEVPGADLVKITTIDESTEDISIASVRKPDVCFIDGEHTRTAALRDARFCRSVMDGNGIVVFHDFQIVSPAALDFLRELAAPAVAYLLRDSVFVVELGKQRSLLSDTAIRHQMKGDPKLWLALNRLHAVRQALIARRRYHALIAFRPTSRSRPRQGA
jgi:hypothetical protein